MSTPSSCSSLTDSPRLQHSALQNNVIKSSFLLTAFSGTLLVKHFTVKKKKILSQTPHQVCGPPAGNHCLRGWTCSCQYEWFVVRNYGFFLGFLLALPVGAKSCWRSISLRLSKNSPSQPVLAPRGNYGSHESLSLLARLAPVL